MQGWIKLFRKLADWEWYDDVVVKSVFIDLLIFANHQDNMWRGQVIKKGSLVTSLATIADRNKLSIQQVRTALSKLEKTGEINKQSTNKNTLIIVLNYERYQELDWNENTQYQQSNNKRSTNEQQSNNKQATTNKNVKNDNNENKDKNVKKYTTVSEDTVCQTQGVRPEVKYILSAWNSLSEVSAVKPVSKMQTSSKRYQMLAARLKEYGLDDVLKAIEHIGQSDFLKGNNNKGWIITFDWFVRPNNFPKVLEGNYNNAEASAYSSNPFLNLAKEEGLYR